MSNNLITSLHFLAEKNTNSIVRVVKNITANLTTFGIILKRTSLINESYES